MEKHLKQLKKKTQKNIRKKDSQDSEQKKTVILRDDQQIKSVLQLLQISTWTVLSIGIESPGRSWQVLWVEEVVWGVKENHRTLCIS